MYYTQEQIDRANQADLVLFLQSQGEQLTRAGQEYRWKRHDSLTVRGNKWYRHSQSKGGAPIDFVMEFYGKSFTEAVEMLTGEKGGKDDPSNSIQHQELICKGWFLPPNTYDCGSFVVNGTAVVGKEKKSPYNRWKSTQKGANFYEISI